MMDDATLQEQIAYYRARAGEYDESIQGTGRFAAQEKDETIERDFSRVMDKVRAVAPVENILELAGGTGIWTQELVKLGQSITVVDASPEMLAINRGKVADDRVHYIQADLFTWKPEQQYDLVFFGFWLSHIPPERLDSFLDMVSQAVQPRGQVIIIDQWNFLPGEEAITQGTHQTRRLADGQQFTIVKVYYDLDTISNKLKERGFQNVTYDKGTYFFYLNGQRP